MTQLGDATDRSPRAQVMSDVLGSIVAVMMRQREYLHYRIADLAAWVRPAVELRQAKALFCSRGRPLGYITWAWLTDELSARFAAGEAPLLRPEEWNGGTHLWVMDLVALDRSLGVVIAALRSDSEFRGHPVHWMSRPKAGRQTKHLTLRPYPA